MKRCFPLLLLAICVLILVGCGGGPSNFQPDSKSGTPAAAPDVPATGSAAPPPPSGQPAAPPQSSSLPAPPGDAVVLDQIHNTTDNWNSCSTCAQGTNKTDNFWMAPHRSSPSISGSSREFYVGGPLWSNALFWKTYYEHMDKTHILWDFYVYWDEKSMSNIWSAEFDFWQSIGGKEFMIGSQCNFGDGFWDLWDSKANQWLHSDVPCRRMEPGKWHHIQWFIERLGADHYRYNTLVVDGESHVINRTFDPNPTDWKDSMGIQWQLDQSANGGDVHQWVDNVKLTVW